MGSQRKAANTSMAVNTLIRRGGSTPSGTLTSAVGRCDESCTRAVVVISTEAISHTAPALRICPGPRFTRCTYHQLTQRIRLRRGLSKRNSVALAPALQHNPVVVREQ